MKCIRVHQFGDPSVLKLEGIPEPKPAQGQLVVRIHAAGVNPVETYIRAGNYAMKPPLPYTPGTDAAGEVESVGPGVSRFRPGDRVYTRTTISGAYAEKALCDANTVYPLPAKATFQQGAALGVPYATAYQGLYNRGNARAGETLLVHGASGGVGTAAVQLARAAGLTVIGTAGTDEGCRLVLDNGAHHVLNHKAPDYLKQFMDLTGGRGVDLILEMAAHVNLGKDLTVLAKHGRVVIIGSRGPVEINPRDGMGRDADIRAMTLMNATEMQLAGIHAAVVAGLENGSLRPVIGKEFPLAEAAAAHKAVLESSAYGKIVLIP
jgi:NADPH2:quinone reductase